MTEEMKSVEIRSEAQPAPKRTWGRIAKPLLGVAVLVVVILWSVGVFRTRTPAGRLEYQAGLPVPPNAELFTVKPESIAPRVDVVGTVASDVKVNLSARIPAYVKEVFVAAGSPVKNGQELITLDDREIKEQVAAAEAQFKQAETEFNPDPATVRQQGNHRAGPHGGAVHVHSRPRPVGTQQGHADLCADHRAHGWRGHRPAHRTRRHGHSRPGAPGHLRPQQHAARSPCPRASPREAPRRPDRGGHAGPARHQLPRAGYGRS